VAGRILTPVIVRRSLRRIVAFVATLAIVAAQTVAVAHACTRASASLAQPAAGQVCPGHGGPAEGASPGSAGANLCEVHCQDASVPVTAVTACAPAAEIAIVVAEPPVALAGISSAEPDAKGAAPPARSRYCRLQL